MVLAGLQTLPRDARFLYRFGKVLARAAKLEKQNANVGQVFDILAKKIPDNPCFYYDNGEVWTYRKVEEESNRIGNYFTSQGFQKGDIVSLVMGNRLEVITTWLGLSKIGVVPALVNYHLVSDILKYSIELVKPKAILCGYELSKSLDNVYPQGEARVPIFCSGIGDRGILHKATDMDKDIKTVDIKTPLPKTSVNYNDNLFYIYTSGTTGLPKAAVVKQSRFLMISTGVYTIIGLKPSDVIYTCFPLQHTAAGVLSVGFALHKGTPLVIRSKFTAHEFWKDCIKHRVTAAQYIGEICRYLLKQPITVEETQHNVRMMFGNGLRPELWRQFQKRFKIPLMSEMYGSTEGNCNMFNIDGQPDAVGFVPPLLQKYWPVNIIKLDENNEPIRDLKTGLVVRAKIGELGELVGKIVDGNPPREFKGYEGDESKSETKIILEDALEKGDKVFRSGDIFSRDKYGYYYFVDRIGDSFRYKGENVSANAIEGVINKISNKHDVVVFGVKVPDVDGSVGMTVIADPTGNVDLKVLGEGLIKELPDFARPRFLRIVKDIPDTSTHKLKKIDLKKDGFDLKKVGNDQIYLFHEKQFKPLTAELINRINSGELTL